MGLTNYLEVNINIKVEYSTMSLQKRLLSVILIITFIFFILLIRIFTLQVIQSQNLQIKAIEQWVRMLPLSANRGKILDNNGNILAISYTTYDLYFRSREIKNPVEVATYISNLLDLDFQKVYQKAMNTSVSENLVKLQLDESVASTILQKNFDGVYVSENIKRFYPYNNSLSQVLGYLTIDSEGQTGIESYYNNILKGTDGKYLTQSDVRGIKLNSSLNYYTEAIDGIDIKLNIDINIQLISENVLNQIVIDHNPKSVSAIVMDPNTSKIIALAISPNFDLNEVPRDDVSTLLTLSKNTTITDIYEPGSTFKIFTLACALSEGLTNENEHFYCPGYRIVDGEKIKCWKTTGHGDQTLIEAIQNSCNCCFMDLGLRIGKEKFYDYLELFGLGSKTGVDASGESSGLLLDENIVKNVDLVRIAFGQTVAVTQLQLLNSFCSIINGGTLNTPSFLDTYSEKNQNLYINNTTKKNRTVSSEISNKICELLVQSLSKTGDMSFIEGYKIAGKTGTAQKYGENGAISQGKYVSSFFGFINQDGANYALLLCVDEPSSGAYYGSVVAKPYAKTIFEKIIKYKNIKPFDSSINYKDYIVPNFINMDLNYAMQILEKENLYYEVDGEGDKVVWQFPKENTEVARSTTILLKTN